ncbi:RidA family protein [Vagococcus hydrophili]|uniref:RidA family protein n=1 Tax=Vagococcus hydrophili TaxID=2714947 RepID=A0A6G8ATB0_9ENTE|nr:RidA family protein [Vagococcus hydrophili]QIL48304.1 RidA family protein [Vagococcus hydrophili]
MSRKIYTGEGVSVSGPYSHAVDAGNTIFFSGQVAKNAPDYQEVTGSIEEQTKQCFKNLEQVLKSANVTFDDVVKVNVYLTTMKNFQGMNAVYETIFSAPYPARTCVAVKELPLEADIEIEMVVYQSGEKGV